MLKLHVGHVVKTENSTVHRARTVPAQLQVKKSSQALLSIFGHQSMVMYDICVLCSLAENSVKFFVFLLI